LVQPEQGITVDEAKRQTDLQVKRMVIAIIEDASYKVKTGLFSNGCGRVKKEVGS
jgi:hypothetical protein